MLPTSVVGGADESKTAPEGQTVPDPDNSELNPVVRRVLERARARRGDAALFRERAPAEEYAGEVSVIAGREHVALAGVYVHRQTERAYQIAFLGDVFWIPKKLIHKPEEVRVGGEDQRILVEVWYARKRQII